MVLRVVALLCAAGAFVLFLAARPPAARAAPTTAPRPPVRTPLWSARRVPALFTGAVANARLGAALASAFAPYSGCAAVDDAGGPIASVNAGTAFQPGSNAKLLTALAALDVLGADSHFTTNAVTTGAANSGTLQGDLVIVGGGDPLISTSATARAPFTKLDDLAAAIASAGIKNINGRLLVDDSRYDSARTVPDWKSNYVPEGEAGSLGALTVDRGYEPNTPRAVGDPDPALVTAQQLAIALHAHGVSVSGGSAHTTAPANAHVVAHIDSVALSAIVDEMLTNSNNYTAEMLAREVGHAHAHDGSTAAGTAAVLAVDAGLGVPTANVVLHDGSGLAPDDRVTCDALLAVVDRMHQPRFQAIDTGLPVAGRTGTLATRFRGDPLAGVLRAKTGSIDGAVALSGTVDAGAHTRFAFIANGNFSELGGQALQAAVAHAVAAYPAPVDPSALVPPP
jgi:D-alanyl-D-alanine carboxypeptidase/D-alanyl-D-alanine-endopeptidase (penicillin-binding protein 4)